MKLLMQCLQLVLVVRIEMQNTDSILKACCQIVFIKRLFQTLIESFTKSQTLQIVRHGHHHQHILFDTKLHVLLESDTSGADSSCRSDDFNKTWEKCRKKGPDSSLKGSRDGWTYFLSLSLSLLSFPVLKDHSANSFIYVRYLYPASRISMASL